MDLNALRDEIDSLDKEILKAFEKRMELCRNVALYKKANGMQIFQSQREKEIIKRVRPEAIYRFWKIRSGNLHRSSPQSGMRRRRLNLKAGCEISM